MTPSPARISLPTGGHLVGTYHTSATNPAFVVVWVHGFGSHRGGEKSEAIQHECARRGWAFAAFDFRGHGESSGAMHELRASRLVEDLAAVRDWLAERGHTRLGLIGSSMGGFATAWFAKQNPECAVGCCFVAPGFGFLDRRWDELTADERIEWERTGRRRLTNAWVDVELGFGLVEERDRFRPVQLVAGWRTPSLLFHGLADEVVPHTDSLFFIKNVGYPHVELRLLKDGDHRLTAYKGRHHRRGRDVLRGTLGGVKPCELCSRSVWCAWWRLPCGAADPPAKTDRYGDPLPPGALMRWVRSATARPITGFGIQKDGIVVTVGPGADVRAGTPRTTRARSRSALPLERAKTFNNDPQVSPDGKLVAVSTNEKVFVWETPTAAKVKPKEVAAFEIARAGLFRFSPDGTKLVVTAEHDQISTIHVCDIKTGKTTSLNANPRYIEGVHFSGDGKRVGVVADFDFYFLDAVTGEQLAKYRTDGRMSSAFALNHTGDVLAARMDYSGPKYEFRFTDPLTGKKLDGLTGPEGWVRWISFTADGKALLVGDRSGIRWWDPTAAKPIHTFEGIAFDAFNHQHTPARFSPDGKTLVAHNGYVLLRWDANTGKPSFPEQNLGHGAYIHGVGVSPDGKRIATGGMDSRVCVWDAATGKELSHAGGLDEPSRYRLQPGREVPVRQPGVG